MNENQFEQVQVIGSKKVVKVVQAEQFPEKLFIRDLIFDYDSMADEISASEYEASKI
jgi:hypothetical protein